MSQPKSSGWDDQVGPFQNALRTVEFWGRAAGIYASYKSAQARGIALRLAGQDEQAIQEKLWDPHHAWAGQQMYDLCISLRGFYLKVTHIGASTSYVAATDAACRAQMGQFIGARGDFVPEQVCRKLSRLHDQVRYVIQLCSSTIRPHHVTALHCAKHAQV
jgi:hypothetical protein